MKLIKILSFLLFITQFSVLAQTWNPEKCSQLLFEEGGFSKISARDQCRQGVSFQETQCQSVLFLALGFSPQNALKYCTAQKDSRSVDCLYKSLLEKKMNHESAVAFCSSSELSNFSKFEYGSIFISSTKDNKKLNSDLPTICSITLNSFNEINAFKKVFKNEKVNFIELLPERSTTHFIPRNQDWLSDACRSKIKCDTLVISGHFADRFLGAAGFEITTQDFLEKSCSNECKDFFNSVSKVFLFGCNTLATKEPDHRSFELYRQTLIEDGLSENEAEKVASQRYQEWGLSFRETMQGIFPMAEVLDGFWSSSPLGPFIESPLTQFLNTFSNYSDFSENLKNTNLPKQLSDLSMIQMNKLSSQWNQYICGLISDQSKSKVSQIIEILNKKQLRRYLYLIHKMSLNLTSAEVDFLNKQTNVKYFIDRNLADLYSDSRTVTSVKLIFLQTFYRLHFLGQKEYFELSRDLILSSLKGASINKIQKKICDYGDSFPVGKYIHFEDFELGQNEENKFFENKLWNCLNTSRFEDRSNR